MRPAFEATLNLGFPSKPMKVLSVLMISSLSERPALRPDDLAAAI